MKQKEIEIEFPHLDNINLLDAGGQKKVYKCNHLKYGFVVLKLIFDISNFERTKREIGIVQNHKFDHVPTIYEYGLKKYGGDNYIFIVEKYVSGETLSDILKKDKIKIEFALQFIKKLLEICVELETHSIVHRDIKPNNIKVDESGDLWLLDFGIARHLGMMSITPTASPYGPHTLGYAAPEQINNVKSKIDVRADIFSIGVLFYEMVTGINPFKENASNRLDVIRNTTSKNPKSLSEQVGISEELSNLIIVMISKYPSRRPPSAKENLDWLKEIIKNREA